MLPGMGMGVIVGVGAVVLHASKPVVTNSENNVRYLMLISLLRYIGGLSNDYELTWRVICHYNETYVTTIP